MKQVTCPTRSFLYLAGDLHVEFCLRYLKVGQMTLDFWYGWEWKEIIVMMQPLLLVSLLKFYLRTTRLKVTNSLISRHHIHSITFVLGWKQPESWRQGLFGTPNDNTLFGWFKILPCTCNMPIGEIYPWLSTGQRSLLKVSISYPRRVTFSFRSLFLFNRIRCCRRIRALLSSRSKL